MKKKYLFCPECGAHDNFGEEKKIHFDEHRLEACARRNPWALDGSALLCRFCQCTIPRGLAERNGITNDGRKRCMSHKEVTDIWHDEYVPFGMKKLW